MRSVGGVHPDLAATVCVARQRIQDADGRVAGHEVLFRPTAGSTGSGEGTRDFDDDAATATVIAAVSTQFDIAEVAGAGLLFVNLPRSFVVGDRPLLLAPGGVVLEVLERVEPDAQVRAGVDRLLAAGFTLALDDVVPDDPRLTLADCCAYIKVDLEDAPGPELDRLVAQVRAVAPHATLVAERVETREDLDRARTAGFQLFQGYLFNRPAVLVRESVQQHAPTVLRLLQLLSEDSTSTGTLALHLSADPATAAQVLRAVNNVTGSRRRVSDLSQALALVGRERLQSILVLGMMAGDGHHDPEVALRAVAYTHAAQQLDAAEPLVAATEALVRLCGGMLGMGPQEVEHWLPRGPVSPGARAACDALDDYLDAADRGLPAQVVAGFTPLEVSVAWLDGVREGHRLLDEG